MKLPIIFYVKNYNIIANDISKNWKKYKNIKIINFKSQ